MHAEIIRFPIERCRKRQAAGIETFMLAPIAFYLRMTATLMSPVATAEGSKPGAQSDGCTASKSNVYRL